MRDSAVVEPVEAGLNWRFRVSAVRVELTDPDMHTLTRESQEVMVGLIAARIIPLDAIVVDPWRVILSTDIPHSGQLNITTSTLATPT